MLNRDEVLCCYAAAYLEGIVPSQIDISAATGICTADVSRLVNLLEQRNLLIRVQRTARRVPTLAGLERALHLGVR